MALLSPKKHFSNLVSPSKGRIIYVDPSTYKAITEKKYENYGANTGTKTDAKVAKKK
jgi:hypothetical protein